MSLFSSIFTIRYNNNNQALVPKFLGSAMDQFPQYAENFNLYKGAVTNMSTLMMFTQFGYFQYIGESIVTIPTMFQQP